MTGNNLVRGQGDSGIPRTGCAREPGHPENGPSGETWGFGKLGVAGVRGRRETEGGWGPGDRERPWVLARASRKGKEGAGDPPEEGGCWREERFWGV